jgi:hypothetical protein
MSNSLLQLVTPFSELLAVYNPQCMRLYTALEPYLTITPFTHAQTVFIPTEKTVAEQLKRWPNDQPISPPVAWVTPRKGQLDVDGTVWSYAFHGAGLSFAHRTSTLDVSVEFARTGEAAMTQWTFRCYLESMDPEPSHAAAMLPLLDMLFDYAVEQQTIRPVPPLIDGDDQTYIVTATEAQTLPKPQRPTGQCS